MELNFLPQPRHLEVTGRRWTAGRELIASLSGLNKGDALPGGIKRVSVNLAPEAYTLKAGPQGIFIESSGDEGTWNALMTLKQMLRQADDSGQLAEAIIRDEPKFPQRGIMLDISRDRVPTMDMLKSLVDLWAELKFNRLQLYTEHTFAYRGHDAVWKHASPFTGAEIQEIDRYCRQRNMELVPNQNSMGHMERWLRHPEYRHLAESPEGFVDPWGVPKKTPETLDLSNPQSRDLLRDLYTQLLPHFQSRSFNVGCDEPFELGQGKNKARCEKEGTGRVYVDFLKDIISEVEALERRPQIWTDIILHHPQLIDEIPRDTVLMHWGYEHDHPFSQEASILEKSGREFHVCPGTSSWNSLGGRWENARLNIQSAAVHGLEHGAAGLMVTDWGDNGHKQQYAVSIPGWAMASACAWTGTCPSDDQVVAVVQTHVFQNSRGNQARKLMELGNLYRTNPTKTHNVSFIMLPLLDHRFPYYRGDYPAIASKGIGSAVVSASEIQNALRNSKGSRWDEQIQFTSDLMCFAAELAEQFFSTEKFQIPQIPVSRRTALARKLESLIPAYRALWGKTSRPGGLNESIEDFYTVLELLG